MAEKFDKIIDTFAQQKYKENFKRTVTNPEKEEILKMVREKTAVEVMDEIRKELKPEIEKEVRESIEEENRLKKLDDLKKLIVEGFAVALIVGLMVNQMTELISYHKGTFPSLPVVCTRIITIVLFVICGIILSAGFIKEFTKMYDNYTKGQK